MRAADSLVNLLYSQLCYTFMQYAHEMFDTLEPRLPVRISLRLPLLCDNLYRICVTLAGPLVGGLAWSFASKMESKRVVQTKELA